MPAMALSRVGTRVAESGPDGENLAAGAWQRLETLPGPRSPQGRIYPLARLRAPWDPVTGRYRVPDEKTIRVVLGRPGPRALTRALTRALPAPPPTLPRRAVLSQRARLPCPARRPAGTSAGPRSVTGRGRGRQDLPRRPPRRRHPGPPPGRRRTRQAPAGPPRGRRQAQRDQPFHRTAGTAGPGRGRGETPPPAVPAADPPTWPPSAPPSPRPSRTPVTCTSRKTGATTPPPPKPSTSTASIRQKWDIHGTRRSPAIPLPPELSHPASEYHAAHFAPPGSTARTRTLACSPIWSEPGHPATVNGARLIQPPPAAPPTAPAQAALGGCRTHITPSMSA